MKAAKRPSAQAVDTTRGDTLYFDVSQFQPASVNLGKGYDTVFVSGDDTVGQVRLTFTSAEVGNDSANDSGGFLNQDGGLAVRMQVEDGSDGVNGTTHRFDDEGIRFVADGNFTFDVRDLVAGTQRGSLFSIVSLGTAGTDRLNERNSAVAAYVNAGAGNDQLTGGSGDDFLVGGSGDDRLTGRGGNDSFIGGGGNDRIIGGLGDDTAIINLSLDGSDRIDLGDGSDKINVSAGLGVTQVRLTFTSAEVGNGSVDDSGALANQDGKFAVRVQAENTDGNPAGAFTRTDDEGVTFVAAAGLTFDVRDLVSGAARGDAFQSVTLGTSGADVVDHSASVIAEYINGGMGDDTITGGAGRDFLVGGAGDDVLSGGAKSDSFIGGAGNDTIVGGLSYDTAIVNASTDGADKVSLGNGYDDVIVSTTASATGDPTQVRLTVTSAEIGNGSDNDSGIAANQDGGLAVRLQVEGADGSLAGSVGRYDDEGITFTATAGTTFDVRDLVSGTARGDQFTVVALGTDGFDTFDQSAATGNVYLNGGLQSDTLTGGAGSDFLVGGGGGDFLDGGAGSDKLLGGTEADTFLFSDTPGDDEILDFASGTDKIDLTAFGITADQVTITSSGGGSSVAVDSDSNGSADFTITVDNVVVQSGDFAF